MSDTKLEVQPFRLTSPAFSSDSPIPEKYTCRGESCSPPFEINNVPNEAESMALIMHDPDAPSGDWAHWLVWNIPPGTTSIAENSLPVGSIEGTTSFGSPRYGSPCPPSGTHHYIFELYALDTMLDLPSTTQMPNLYSAMQNHILAQSQLIGLFG